MKDLSELIECKSTWTLQEDSNLIYRLTEMTEDFLGSMARFDEISMNMKNDTELLKLRLENIHNNIHLLKTTKLVEESIADPPPPVRISHKVSEIGVEERTTDAIKRAVANGFQLIDNNFNEIQITSTESNTPTFVIKSAYANRPLPSVIGSAEFRASTDANLGVHTGSAISDLNLISPGNVAISRPPTGQLDQDTSVFIQKPEFDAISDRAEDSASLRFDTDRRLPSSGVSSIGKADSRSLTPSNQSLRADSHHSSGSNKSITTPLGVSPKDAIISGGHSGSQPSDFRDSLAAALHTRTSSLNPAPASVSPVPEKSPAQEKSHLRNEPVLSSSRTSTSEGADILSSASNKAPLGSSLQKSAASVPNQPKNQVPSSTVASSNSPIQTSGVSNKRASALYSQFNSFASAPSTARQPPRKIGRGLFSSSSSSAASDDDENIKKYAPTKENKPSPLVDKAEKPPPTPVPTPAKDEDDDEMSKPKPVLKAFDANFSDRLSATLLKNSSKTGAVGTIGRRPVSISSIPSDNADRASISDELKLPPQRPSRPPSRLSVSSNEELGPSSVASRIAQIGNKIPVGMKRDSTNDETKADMTGKVSGNDSTPGAAGLPPLSRPSTSAVMSRAKGPARRAPTKLATATTAAVTAQSVSEPHVPKAQEISTTRSESTSYDLVTSTEPKAERTKSDSKASTTESRPNASQAKTVETLTRKPPPSVTTAKSVLTSKTERPKKKSIFDSSTSDEDDFLAPRSSATNTTNKAPTSATTTTERKVPSSSAKASISSSSTNQSRPPPSSAQPKKKGLFDDSDSDI